MQRTYLAIDLKSYYASAECAARHLDPLTTNLVVADSSRTEKTIYSSRYCFRRRYGLIRLPRSDSRSFPADPSHAGRSGS